RVWGKFDVKDDTCKTETWWETPKHDACTTEAHRQWSAIITGRNYAGDWLDACRSTPLRVGSTTYHARKCSWNGGRVWGEFDISDESCAAKLWFMSPVSGDCSKNGFREHNAVITGEHYSGDWVTACKMTKANIGGTLYASRNCGWRGTRVWGS